jgi:hypothetical protein
MRKVILTAICILAIVIMISINTASAENRHRVIEMGEGGQTISFPMTDEEIPTINAENARRVHGDEVISQKLTPRFKTFTMGESGQVVSFLMTPEEIAAEDSEKSRLTEIPIKSSVDETQTVAYEMAESGMLIEFPERVIKVNPMRITKLKNL